MIENVGCKDKVLKIIFGIGIILTGWLVFGSWWAMAGILPLLSGIFSKCMIYKLFGISTIKSKA